ncbi:F0F1 ATP synthase subunit delta [Sandaracinobacteroides saxicola]|uniref:ATP synthase subunit delta n=2 Tax=Sandaracinobacteroides saxicola TaxID=2759707 RepID=A0A7G5IM14_9SPHN|nr:F0F1 ATP synthase subunit delta [Sandaracinobacteroides saxicola]QMW24406.1 F0F1 ATP synthase subunit delta [Sandaracinobacteroides saxicola]
MISNSLSGRYAGALFDLAKEAKAVDAVGASLDTLETATAESSDLKALMTSPLVSRADAARAVAALAAAMGLHPLVAQTLGVLARNGRLSQTPAMIRAFRAAVAASKGEVTAEVTAAHALSPKQTEALKAKLTARTGRDIALDIRVVPEILGGLIVKIGSEQIDSSLKTRLEKLGQAMKG